MTDDEYLPAVRGDERTAADYAIQGVPFFVADGRYGLAGAQRADVFVEALSEVAAARAPVPGR